ncbi:MAG: hypothetical protein OHK0047_41920 [Leptolyngbyaceae cyanobacterium]
MVPNLAASLTGKISLYDNLSIHGDNLHSTALDLDKAEKLGLPEANCKIIPHCCLIRISNDTAFRPDVTVLDQT